MSLNPPETLERATSAPDASKPPTTILEAKYDDLKEAELTFDLPGPEMIQRAQTFTDSIHDHQPTQTEMDSILESLRSSAEQMKTRIPQHGFFDVEFVGVQHARLNNPLHFLIHDEIMVAELRGMLGTRFNIAEKAILLLYAGWFLADDHPLRDYGIQNGSQIVVVFQENVDEKEPENSTPFDVGPQPEPITMSDQGPLIGQRLRLSSKTDHSRFSPCRIIRADTKVPRVRIKFDVGGEEDWLHLLGEASRFEHRDNPLDFLAEADENTFHDLAAEYVKACRMSVPSEYSDRGLAFHFHRVFPDATLEEIQVKVGTARLEKYQKMLRVGVPRDAVLIKMNADGCTEEEMAMLDSVGIYSLTENVELVTDYAHFAAEFQEKMVEQRIQAGDIPRANILADWEIFSASYTGFERERTDENDMITFMAEENEPRYKMPCGHAITSESLRDYVSFQLKEGKIRITCPHVNEEQSQCGFDWTWPVIRLILQAEHDVIADLETKWAFNVVTDKLNAQKCSDCGALLFRDKMETGYKASCPNCERIAKSKNPNADEVPVRHFCWGCRTEWTDPSQITCGNPLCSAQWIYQVLEVLKGGGTKTIGQVEGVPAIRACVNCGQLITHWTACKHMQCYVCKKSFCFVCLLPCTSNGWQCGSSGTVCPIAPVQETQIFAYASRNILNLRHELEDEAVTRNEWTSGAQVEVYDEEGNRWLEANIVEIQASEDGNDECDIVLNDDPDKHFALRRHDVHVRPRVFRPIFEPEATEEEKESPETVGEYVARLDPEGVELRRRLQGEFQRFLEEESRGAAGDQ